MRFLYKIYSGYDGFTPKRIPKRLLPRNELALGWTKYIEVAEEGQEVWVYFHGPHAFRNGVYVKGFISKVDLGDERVQLKVREYSTARPLTDAVTSRRVAEAVGTRNRQVFVFPEALEIVPDCTVGTTVQSCRDRRCEGCPVWQSLSTIGDWECGPPERFEGPPDSVIPAYWVIPSRCYLGPEALFDDVKMTSEIFYQFKLGEEALAFPLALGIFRRLRERRLLHFDAVIPIPLSPSKVESGELHRALRLAQELARLLGSKVRQALRLSKPISKRALLSAGYTMAQFEDEYSAALRVDRSANAFEDVLVVDDVITRGSTLTCALRKIREISPNCRVTVAAAGQMIVKPVIKDESYLSLE